MSELNQNKPWYRHPMVWLVLAIPLWSVIAGIYFINIAMSEPNDVVNDDYYKEGLAINQSFIQDNTAKAMGLSALLTITEQQLQVKMTHVSQPFIKLALIHSRDSDLDVQGAMALVSKEPQGGVYRYNLESPLQGSWAVELSGDEGDSSTSWRLRTKVMLPLAQAVTILPVEH